MTRRSARWLHGIAATVAVAALAWRMVPVRLPLRPAPPDDRAAALPAPDPNATAAALLAYDDIARRDPFDAGRQPPRQRYIPPELRSQVAAPGSPTPAPPDFRLVGVAAGPSGAVALIDANPAIPGAEIYRLGDRVGDFRIESISDTAVVLRGATGTRTLRLEPHTGRSR